MTRNGLFEALANGVPVEHNYYKDQWQDASDIDIPSSLDFDPAHWRLKQIPVMVPLGPEDVPPGSVFLFSQCKDYQTWNAPFTVTLGGIHIWMDGARTVGFISWGALQEKWLIKRPGSNQWEKCERQAR